MAASSKLPVSPEYQQLLESTATLDIFNDRHFAHKHSLTASSASFSCWQDLPKEIRLKIWASHLSESRLLRIEISEPQALGRQDEIIDREGQRQELEVLLTFRDDPTTNGSALQYVCRESYEAYKKHYRIRFPAFLTTYNRSTRRLDARRIVAHLHPELDILSLYLESYREAWSRKVFKYLPLALHTLIQHDTSPPGRRFGPRSLCVDLSWQPTTDPDINFSDLSPEVLSSSRLCLLNLRNLYFRHLTPRNPDRIPTTPFPTPQRSRTWYNASLPILSCDSWDFSPVVESVQALYGDPDPRLRQPDAAADLRKVLFTQDPIDASLDLWIQVEQACGVHRKIATANGGDGLRVRALVAVNGQYIYSEGQPSVQAALRTEFKTWLRAFLPKLPHCAIQRELFASYQAEFLGSGDESTAAPYSPEDWIRRRIPETAVGFWLIEPEALQAAKNEVQAWDDYTEYDLSHARKEAIELWVMKKW